VKDSLSVDLKRAVMFKIAYLLLGVNERFPCPAEEKAILPVFTLLGWSSVVSLMI
jgi:hypothetical protein